MLHSYVPWPAVERIDTGASRLPTPAAGRDKGQIWLWLRPTGKVPAVQEDVRRVALSTEAACMSFAHLLALLLDARFLSLGGQSLQVRLRGADCGCLVIRSRIDFEAASRTIASPGLFWSCAKAV